MDIKKLEKWVDEHPEDADAKTINMTTGKEFTIREVLKKLKKADKEGVEILDKDELEIKDQVEKWLKEV